MRFHLPSIGATPVPHAVANRTAVVATLFRTGKSMQGSRDLPGHMWRKSTFSASSNCVEVCVRNDAVQVRNTRDHSVVVNFTGAEWTAFVAGVRDGQFDPGTLGIDA